MECYYHPNKEGVNTCTICGKTVCEECSLEIAGKMYCKECLEKIVGIGIDNKVNEENTEIESKSEPVRLGKKEEAPSYTPEESYEEPIYQAPSEEKTIFASGLNSDLDQANDNIYGNNLQKEESIYDSPMQQDYPQKESVAKPISNDSPYNINGMGYSKEINDTKKSYFKKESAPYLDQPNDINQDQRIVEQPQKEFNPYQQQPQNEYNQYQPQQPQTEYNQYQPQDERAYQQPQSAQNEYDQYQQPQNDYNYQQQEYIFPDHSYEPEETSARQALEDKYEKYLDDLYFDETEVPLEEQLAKDEEQYGSLTRKPYTPTPKPVQNEPIQQQGYAPQQMAEPGYMPQANEQQMYAQQKAPNMSYREEPSIQGQFNIRQDQAKKPIHDIKYEDEKEPFGIIDIILTIILIIAILIVLFYIVYLFCLSTDYPTFLDAVFGLQDPGKLIGNLMK